MTCSVVKESKAVCTFNQILITKHCFGEMSQNFVQERDGAGDYSSLRSVVAHRTSQGQVQRSIMLWCGNFSSYSCRI